MKLSERLLQRIVLFVGLITISGLITTASAFDLSRAKTEAEDITSEAGDRFIQFELSGKLINGLPDLTVNNVEFGWGEVGGIQPEPFKILIPKGCFVSRRDFRVEYFQVENFQACGVQMLLVEDTGAETPLPIMEFEAKVVKRNDGNSRFDLVTRFGVIEPCFLEILGGSEIRIAIEADSSSLPPLRIVTVSGIDPEPF